MRPGSTLSMIGAVDPVGSSGASVSWMNSAQELATFWRMSWASSKSLRSLSVTATEAIQGVPRICPGRSCR